MRAALLIVLLAGCVQAQAEETRATCENSLDVLKRIASERQAVVARLAPVIDEFAARVVGGVEMDTLDAFRDAIQDWRNHHNCEA